MKNRLPASSLRKANFRMQHGLPTPNLNFVPFIPDDHIRDALNTAARQIRRKLPNQ